MSGIVPKPICWSLEEILSTLKKFTNFLIFSRQKSAKNACMIKSSCLQMFCKIRVLENLAHRKTPMSESLFTQSSRSCNVIRIETPTHALTYVDFTWLILYDVCFLQFSDMKKSENSWILTVVKFPVFYTCLSRSPIPYQYSSTKQILLGKEIYESKSVNIYLNLPYTFYPVLNSIFC